MGKHYIQFTLLKRILIPIFTCMKTCPGYSSKTFTTCSTEQRKKYVFERREGYEDIFGRSAESVDVIISHEIKHYRTDL